MSAQNAVAFMNKVREDKALQAELRKLNPTDFDGLLKVSERLGFGAFSQQDYYHGAETVGGEWVAWAAKLANKPMPEELTDADLEQVAGGKGDGGGGALSSILCV